MEVRKLQLIGGSSYMISLPKDWIRSNELKQGDEILLQISENSITVYPKKFIEDLRVTRVKVDKIPRLDEKFIRRYIFALYIQGIDEIVIEDKNVNARVISKISEIVKQLIGMEIIDASEGRIVLKCLATTDFDFYGVIKRMTQIISSMLSTIHECLKLGDLEGLKELSNLENDSDRLYLLAIRQEHRLVKELSTPNKWDELKLILGVRTVAKLLEEIADSLNEFSEQVSSSYSKFENIILDLRKAFENVSKAYITSDMELSEDSIELLENIEEKILKEMKNENEQNKIALHSLLSACRYMKSIGEIAFNKSVRETLPVK